MIISMLDIQLLCVGSLFVSVYKSHRDFSSLLLHAHLRLTDRMSSLRRLSSSMKLCEFSMKVFSLYIQILICFFVVSMLGQFYEWQQNTNVHVNCVTIAVVCLCWG